MIVRCTLLLAGVLFARASGYSRGFIPEDGSDLETYVSRPDIRSPKFDISVLDEDLVTPGYWFVSPYVDVRARLPSTVYSAGQTGPHIYDNKGNLVWSGAHLLGERATYDFRVVNINDTQHLTFIANEDMHARNFTSGAGVILDSSYNVVQHVPNKRGRGTMNMHEFNVIDNGKSALMITYNPQLYDLSTTADEEKNAWIGNNGFQEVDLTTGETVFEWWPLDHLHPFESLVKHPNFPGNHASPWDFFHMNSVDKTPSGDYLISARYTSTIYLISHTDGSILWRLGGAGATSSFTHLDAFSFSSQHDARVLAHHGSLTTISFLDNAADDATTTATHSSALHVELDTATWTARVVQRHPRPDAGLTRLRGNVQTLPSGAVVVGWSENAYVSEFAPGDGALVLEARFASHRFFSYRSYKFNFTGHPTEPPRLVAAAYGAAREGSTTVVHVSWNGATEVAAWRFWGAREANDEVEEVASRRKEGFETRVMLDGFWARVSAQALDAQGNSLGRSDVVRVEEPKDWEVGQRLEVAIHESKPGVYNHEKLQQYGQNGDDNSELKHRKPEGIVDAVAAWAWKDLVEQKAAMWTVAGIVGVCAAVCLIVLLLKKCRRSRKSWMHETYTGLDEV